MTTKPAADQGGRILRKTLAGALAALLFAMSMQVPAAAADAGAQPASGGTEVAAPAGAEQQAAAQPAAPAAAVEGAGKPILSFDALPHDLSPWSMFLGAGRVVKVVMTMLVIASILTWTVWLSKSFELRQARRKLAASLLGLDEAPTLADAASRADPVVATMISAARKEMAHFPMPYGEAIATGIKERIAARLDRIEAAAGKRMRRGTTVLASIGATAPFVGLFGTVWGIMNSFVGHLQGADHESCGGCAGHCRSAARNGARAGRGHPGGAGLQHVRAGDIRLSRVDRRCRDARHVRGQS